VHAKAVRKRGIFFDAASKTKAASIAATASCAGSIFGVRGCVKRAKGKLAVAGTEIVSATLLTVAAVVAGFGAKLQVKPAGGLLQESCTLPPAFPAALKANW
jgi:hypothetical protein